MRSQHHKVLHHLAGKPLIQRVLDLVAAGGAQRTVVVLGHAADDVRSALPEAVDTVIQEQQLGTGHAVRVAVPWLQSTGAGRVLVHVGDSALVRPASLDRLLGCRVSTLAPIALLTARVRDPRGYGRVLRRSDGEVERIVEEVDATPAERDVDEIWSGTILFHAAWLWPNLERLTASASGEYYLPDLVNLARAQGLSVLATPTEDEEEVLGVNDRVQLAQAEAIVRRRKIDDLLRSGVTVVDPATTYVEPEVEVEPDAVIQPGCHLRGRTRIGRDCEIGPNSYMIDSTVGAGSRVWFSVLEGAVVGERVSIGPFSHLRPGAVIGDDVELGNYAEVKASRIGSATQMHHFSYVGDADVGERVNIAAGTITANFDSETRDKRRTVVDDDASIGCDTVLVAPVHVGAGAITGAGTVLTHDVPAGEVWLGAPARPYRARRSRSADEAP
jgi:bifunctional UDP-N-acetylglucosamine pyrophosphorylase/glucosamine-1-phosphate N-acetyltransferase